LYRFDAIVAHRPRRAARAVVFVARVIRASATREGFVVIVVVAIVRARRVVSRRRAARGRVVVDVRSSPLARVAMSRVVARASIARVDRRPVDPRALPGVSVGRRTPGSARGVDGSRVRRRPADATARARRAPTRARTRANARANAP